MKKVFLIIFLIVISSCSSDDENCLNSLTTLRETVRPTELKEIYSDVNYKINLSRFITPNGDAVNDIYVIYIEDLVNNTFYVSDDFGINGNIIDANSSEDPTLFFTTIDLKVSTNCTTVYESSDINDYLWRLDFQNPVDEGNYNLDLTLTMFNSDVITVSDNFDLYYTLQ
ncbi:hypothetical protein LY01_02814 [Nonlabens xylanidelens]|uniref:Uncharacterized protein n=1 Tax=Nonlabens xylanidelens TaxID=191564 RepID=A0A2S6IEU9_9FLAO|nr:hypothetical protein [Nonlabens xylanidelens]PPK92729.1 hypothetical protein LY01_02814 [Nonlabens xylanidelens]PQJ19776.1 hypothetical protein BST94_05905 [Nonlabens xylanidelens]